MDLSVSYTIVLPGDTAPTTITPQVNRRTRPDGETLTAVTELAPLLADQVDQIADEDDRLHVLTLLQRARIVLSDRSDPGWDTGAPTGVTCRDQGRIRVQYQDNRLLPVGVLLDLAVRLRAAL